MSRLLAIRTAVLTAVLTVPLRPAARFHVADREAGMTTAEYAVGTVAACGFGGVLYKLLTSPQVLDLLKQVILRALKFGF